MKNYKWIITVALMITMIAVTVMQYIMSYSVFSYNLRATYRYFTSINVEETVINTNKLMEEYKAMAAELSVDGDLKKLWVGYSLEKSEREDISDKLRFYYRSMGHMAEIYIYNDTNKTLYREYNLEGEPLESNKVISKLLKNRKENTSFDFIMSVDETSYLNTVYVIYYPFRKSDNAIILKPDFAKFSDVFERIYFYNNGMFCIANENGEIYYGSNVLSKENLSAIMKSDGGYSVKKIEGKVWMLYCAYDEMMDKYFVFGIPENSVIEHLQLQRGSTLIGIFVIAVILIIAVVILVSNFFTRKIEMIKLRAAGNVETKNKDSEGFAETENILNMAIFSKNSFDINSIYNIYDVGVDFLKPVTLLLLQISDYEEFCVKYTNEEERKKVKYYIISVVLKNLRRSMNAAGMRLENDKMLLLLNDTENSIRKNAKAIIYDMSEHTEIRFNVYIGEPTDCRRLGEQYKKLEELVKYRFIRNDKNILCTDVLDEIVTVDYNEMLKIINRIGNYVVFGNAEKAVEETSRLFGILRKSDVTTARYVVFELVGKIGNAFESMEEKFGIHIADKKLLTVWEVDTEKSLDEIYGIILNIFAETKKRFEVEKNNKTKLLTEQIKEYINDSYMNNDLGIEVIAEAFGMSATYIGRVFKKEYGDSITNLITEVRISKAAYLLENTSVSVAEVAKKTGFNSASYMGAQFKKTFGMTPSDYRNLKSNKL